MVNDKSVVNTDNNSGEQSGFAHLHVHTEYSLQDGLSKIPELVQKVKESGMTACAITDHGVCYGLVEFYDTCKAAGIKPILGCECYIAPGSRFDKEKDKHDEKVYHHLILLVKNDIGYRNLCILVSRSNTEGFYYKPRIDFDLLSQYSEGLICLSACIAGEVPRYILEGKEEKAKETIYKYKDLFGEDYYLEIQNHGLKEEFTVQQSLVRFSKECGVKLVATNDSHYVNSEDKEAHEWLLCLQTGKTINDTDRLIYEGDYSIKTPEEMRSLFPYAPEACDNTMEIADKCHFEFEYGKYRMPKVYIPEEYGSDFFAYLRDEAWKGFERKYPDAYNEREKVRENLKYELSVIKDMGFAEYFLDTRKTILWAKNNGILVGPGRGSAAGSVLCYCLDITEVDPNKYSLLFERFLNPERVSMPDIDVDYDYAYREAIVHSESESNGKDKFAKIQTFGTMLAKGVLRDCTRIAGLPASVGSTFSKMIPSELGITLEKALKMNAELRDFIESDDEIKKIWNIALKLEGIKKSAGTHACGHIPTPIPCEELFPVSVDANGVLVCQYNMVQAEHLGNLKKDLLMLRNLTVINVAQKLIKERKGIEIPLWGEEVINDTAALKMIAEGKTDGVFQLESDGMKNFMRELKPDCFEDIIAGVALYRPGPMDFIPVYEKGKRDPSSITYLTPMLEDILSATYGVIVYQEQVMKIVQKLGNFTMAHADILRKAMGKKKMKIMAAERINFVDGCRENQINEEIANQIYDQMLDFAKYAFNKSHAACYAVIAMQTAYLKCHYELEFNAGLLSSVMDNTKKLTNYIAVAKKSGIQILPPDLNFSEKDFSISEDKLRFGLLALKGIGEDILDKIIEERRKNGAYKSITDVVKRNKSVNRKVLESLIKSGAMDFTGNTRSGMLNAVDGILKSIRKDAKEQVSGQISLFDMTDDTPDVADYIVNGKELSRKDFLNYEKEVSGVYISGHPLEDYTPLIQKHTTANASDLTISEESNDENTESLSSLFEGQSISIAGIVKKIKIIYTKKDNRQMAFLSMEDLYGDYSAVVFPTAYEKYKSLLLEDAKILLEGKVGEDNESYNVLVEKIVALENFPKKIWIRFSNKEERDLSKPDIKRIKDIQHTVGEDILILYEENGKTKEITSIQGDSKTMESFIKKYGEDNIRITW